MARPTDRREEAKKGTITSRRINVCPPNQRAEQNERDDGRQLPKDQKQYTVEHNIIQQAAGPLEEDEDGCREAGS